MLVSNRKKGELEKVVNMLEDLQNDTDEIKRLLTNWMKANIDNAKNAYQNLRPFEKTLRGANLGSDSGPRPKKKK